MIASSVQPRHIAIVMDGNGRWASKRLLPRIAGHRQGVESLKRIVRACAQRHIPNLTVFAFSSENWGRPEEEVSGLMELLAMALAREVAQLHKEGVKLHFVGARENLAANVRKGFAEAEELTLNNTSLTLNVCFNYGGRWDIVDAAARLARDGVPITVESMSNAVCLANGPEPDLFIRTGGEMRLSNFLLWQAAYSELYFSDLLWPDFDAAALDMAIAEFSLRERRFGKISQPTAVSTDAHS